MAIITFAGQKGGIGKSALTMHLGAEWLRRRQSVLLVDADPQAHVLEWHGKAVSGDHEAPAAVGVGDGLRAVVGPLARKHDLTLIDTAGRHSGRLGGALAITDLVLLPAKPEPGDVSSLRGSVAIVRETQVVRPDLLAAIVITCANDTVVGREVEEEIHQCELPVLATVLRRYGDYSAAQRAGRGVTVFRPRSKATAQLHQMIDELEELLR